MRAVLMLSLMLAVAAPVHAQEACTESDPCPIDLDVDAAGFIGVTTWNATAGDWLSVSVTVWDELPIDITIGGVEQTFYPDGDDAMVFQASEGTMVLEHESGDTAVLNVAAAPASEAGADGTSTGQTIGEAVENIPGPEIAAAIALLVVLAWRRP